MSRPVRRTLLVATAGVLAGAGIALAAALVATAVHPTPGTPARALATHPAPTHQPDDLLDLSTDDALDDLGEPSADDMSSALEQKNPLAEAWLADAPSGTAAEIAVRFLQALQRRDDVAADRELFSWDRMWFGGESLAVLHRVMAQVRHNAGLDHAAPCTDGVRLNREAALVRCGPLRVVVHVLHDELASGVQIGSWSYHHDVYRGPHTHAITNDPNYGA